MKTHFLFPYKFKIIGWILFIPSLIFGIYTWISNYDYDVYFRRKVFAIICDPVADKTKYLKVIANGMLDELILCSIIIGGILVVFSKLKNEDELISKIRYESLVWSTYFNFAIIIVATLFIYDFAYFNVLIGNIFSILFFFIIRFHFMIYKLNKTYRDDE